MLDLKIALFKPPAQLNELRQMMQEVNDIDWKSADAWTAQVSSRIAETP